VASLSELFAVESFLAIALPQSGQNFISVRSENEQFWQFGIIPLYGFDEKESEIKF
jgi:hypothetical protein